MSFGRLPAHTIGLMQGRLLPAAATDLAVQSFPWETWRQEFALAKTCGFDAIEWLVTGERVEDNPIWSENGLNAIRGVADTASVAVGSICAHYFIAHPLFRGESAERDAAVRVLDRLVAHAAVVGARTIVVPVLEEAEPGSATEVMALIESLRGPIDRAGMHGVKVALEMNCPAREWRAILDELPEPAGACYDIGNAAASGYRATEDLAALLPRVHAVHVKDRGLGGASVPLGEGDADVAGALAHLRDSGWNGLLTLETPTGEDPVSEAVRNLAFVRVCLSEISPSRLST